MKNKPLGCLSPLGILSALVTVTVVLLFASLYGSQMFSPGALNAEVKGAVLGGVSSHADLSDRCDACHTAPWDRQGMSERCLACHTELITDQQNFHRVMLAQSQAGACYDCHTDHQGANASLTLLNLSKFPHLSVGFSLQAHQTTTQRTGFSCDDCHTTSLSIFDAQVCSDCHALIEPAFIPVHVSAFGAACLECHDGVDRYGAGFDHNRLAFQLAGQHATVACGDCHAGARSVKDLQSAPQDCSSCHRDEDPHLGRFGTACESCHTPVDWGKASFDHANTAFPLSGRHVNIPCEQCHVDKAFSDTPRDCAACHLKDDFHQGQFGIECGVCHTPEDWAEATFDHSKAVFKLEGAHRTVPCEQCHINGQYKGTPLQCADCHLEPDIHAGLFPGHCSTCHSVIAWIPAQFNQPHTFPIDHGEGGTNTCKTCHPTSMQSYTCYSCHEHNEAEIAAEHREEGIGDFHDCMRCHPTGREEEGEGGGRGGDD